MYSLVSFSNDYMVILNIYMAYRIVPFIVVTYLVIYLTGCHVILVAFLGMNSLPEPVSRNAQITFPSILTGIIGGSVSSR